MPRLNIGVGRTSLSTRINTFSPLQLSGLSLWLNADTVAGSDGDLISTWTDDSGNSRNATASGTLRGTLKRNILNGKSVIRFAGGQGYATGNINFTGTNAMTVFAVVSCTSGNDRCIAELSNNSANVTTGWILFRQATGNLPVASLKGNALYSNNISRVAIDSTSQYHILSSIFDKSKTTHEVTLWTNGFNTQGTGQADVNNTNAFANLPIYIGARGQSSLYWNGDIAQILVYNRALSTTERIQVEDYLNALYSTFARLTTTSFSDSLIPATGVDSISDDTYFTSSALSRVRLTTSATRIDIPTQTTIYGTFPAWVQIGVRSDGTDIGTYTTSTAAGSGVASVTLPAGNNKDVSVTIGLQTKPSSTILGTYIGPTIYGNAPIRITSPVNDAFVVYGDSISVGANATNPPLEAWVSLLRAYTTIRLEGYGYRTLYDDAANDTLRATFVTALTYNNPANIYLAIGTNDYGLNKWNAASFGTAYAALLDDIHSALPNTTIYCQTPILRVSPASELANGSGSTLGNYRSQIISAQSARNTYCVLVDGTGILSAGSNYASDGLHPSTSGHAVYAAAVKAAVHI